jgi:hypothetical protein
MRPNGWRQRHGFVLLLLLALVLSACGSNNEAALPDPSPAPIAASAQPSPAPSTAMGDASPEPSAEASASAEAERMEALPEATDQADGAMDPISITEVVDDPAAYEGQTVEIREEVAEVITPNAFTLEERFDREDGDFRSVLVIGAAEDLNIGPQSYVRVSGTVQQLDAAALQERLGSDLDPTLLETLAALPFVVVDDEIDVIPDIYPYTYDPAPFAEGSPEPPPTTDDEAADALATVAQIVASPDTYLGQTVIVVDRVVTPLAPTVFTIEDTVPLNGPDEPSMLVIADPGDIEAVAGQRVRISGDVRRLDEALIAEELGDAVDPAQLEPYLGQPVLVAFSIIEVVRAAELFENPELYTNRVVTLIGEVERDAGPSAFLIDEDALFAGGLDNELLVIGPGDAGQEIQDANAGALVQATGTVLPYDLSTIEERFTLELNNDWIEQYDGTVALIGQSVVVIDQ